MILWEEEKIQRKPLESKQICLYYLNTYARMSKEREITYSNLVVVVFFIELMPCFHRLLILLVISKLNFDDFFPFKNPLAS